MKTIMQLEREVDSKMAKVARAYLITLNNPEHPDLSQQWIEGLFTRVNKVAYVNGQLERGENGTLHIQAYVHFKSPQRGSVLKKYCN
jgi:hypothetical protein